MITVHSKSQSLIVYEQGSELYLFVQATSDTPTGKITYTWKKDGDALTNDTPILLIAWNLPAGEYTVRLTDSSNDIKELVFNVVQKVQWFAGVTGDSRVVPQKDPQSVDAPRNEIGNINYVHGGFHLYNNLDEMLNIDTTWQKLTYGQYAYVRSTEFVYDKILNTNNTPSLVDKVYRFIENEPKLRFTQFNDARTEYINNPESVFNARFWYRTEKGNGSGAVVECILDESGFLPATDTDTILPGAPGIHLVSGGSGYSSAFNWDTDPIATEESPIQTVAAIYTNDLVLVGVLNVFVVNGVVTRIDCREDFGGFANGPIGPFTETPVVVILDGKIFFDSTINPPIKKWVIGVDWEEKVFLNCVPDNVTTKIVNGQLSAMVQSSFTEPLWTDNSQALDVITPTYDMSRLVGHNAIQVLEDIIYPYQNVTISLTGYNNNTPVFELVENGNKITLTRVAAEIKNFDNLVDNSSVELKIVHGNQGQILSVDTSNIISKTKQEIVAANGIFNFTVNINDPSNSNNTPGYFLTLSAIGIEYGENYDGGHAVSGKQQFDWAHRIYYIKDSNASITGNYSVPNDAGRTEPTLTPQGIYQIPKTAEPEYVWFLIPADMSVTEIGLPEQNIPFYQYATDQGNKFVTTNVNITVGSASIQYAYKGYRSSFKTASDVTVTIL